MLLERILNLEMKPYYIISALQMDILLTIAHIMMTMVHLLTAVTIKMETIEHIIKMKP